jgi:tetratricopeptide (TPR) repeat protein
MADVKARRRPDRDAPMRALRYRLAAATHPEPVLHVPRRPSFPILAAVLLAAIAAAYWPALRGGFVWDDDAHVTPVDLQSGDGLIRIWTRPGATQQYYPLAHTAFWLQWWLFGDDPSGYHVVNVAVHAANALLAWALLRRLAIPGAAWVAGLFALHPVLVESVAWISELKNTLSTFFYLAAMLAYLRFDPPRRWDERSPEPRRHRWYAAALALFLAAVLTKTFTGTLPAAILIVRWWRSGRVHWRSDILPLLPFFALGIGLGMVTMNLEEDVFGASGDRFSLSWMQRCLLAGQALWHYIGTLVWPAELAFFYERWSIDPGRAVQYVPSIAAVAGVVALWLARRRLGRGPLAAALLFGGTIFPALGFFNLFWHAYTWVCDHMLYLPALPLFALAAGGGAALAARLPRAGRGGLAVVAAAVLALLGVLSWRQSRLYADYVTLLQATLARNPKCNLCHNNLGAIQFQRGDVNGAIASYLKALEIDRGSPEARYNLAAAYQAIGRHGEAVEAFRLVVDAVPDADAFYNMGLSLSHLGRSDESIEAFREAALLRPTFVQAHSNLGNLLLSLGRPDEAIDASRAALAADPQFAPAHRNIARAHLRAGRPAEAAASFRAALAVRGDYVEAMIGLAWVLAAHADPAVVDGEEATHLAQRASQVAGEGRAEALDALAAACARCGRFDEAVTTAREAESLAAAGGQARLAARIAARRRLYERGQPYISPGGEPTSMSD